MKVYSVEEIVDLGNHVIRIFSSRGVADELCKELNKDMQEKLMKNQVYFEVNEYQVEDSK